MPEFKNVKVPRHTHEKLVSRANALGVKKFVLADALLTVGLALPDSEIQKAVADSQQNLSTLPPGGTTPGPPEAKS
jgi:hypothetical protein